MRWLIADSLSCPEQFFCSHLDSMSWYLAEAGEAVFYCSLTTSDQGFIAEGARHCDVGVMERSFDVLLAMDQFDRGQWVSARKKVAQIAAICRPMPWEVRRLDGTPEYDLVISSIPWMVEAARAAGCRAEFQRLAFDHRALVCSMGVEKDIDCLFVGTRDGNHVKREQVLRELGSLVTIAPPTYGREYYKLVSRARLLIHVGAEWSRGCRNALRLYEGAGLATLVISDGDFRSGDFGWYAGTPGEFRDEVSSAIGSGRAAAMQAARDQAHVLQHDGYVQRVPDLLSWVRSI